MPPLRAGNSTTSYFAVRLACVADVFVYPLKCWTVTKSQEVWDGEYRFFSSNLCCLKVACAHKTYRQLYVVSSGTPIISFTPSSPPPSDPRLRRRKQPAVPSALILTFSFFLTTAGKRATTPIHKSAWFIALLVLIAILLIVLLIFVLYTRRRGSKYPGKTIMVIEVRGVWHHVLLKAKILSSFFVDAEMDNIENKLDCVLNTRYSCKALICFISLKLVNARRNEPLISSTGNHSMKKKVLTNTKGKRMPGIIYILPTYEQLERLTGKKFSFSILNELQLLKSNTDKDLARNCI